MNPHLSTEIEAHDGVKVLAVTGEIDLATAPDLESMISEAASGTERLIIDLSKVKFIDSTGLRALLSANEAAQADDRKLILVVVEGPVTKLFDITGVTAILATAASRDAAAVDG